MRVLGGAGEEFLHRPVLFCSPRKRCVWAIDGAAATVQRSTPDSDIRPLVVKYSPPLPPIWISCMIPPFANPFETSCQWFADSGASSLPPLNDLQDGVFLPQQTSPSPICIELRVRSIVQPTRRVPKGKCRSEETRIRQNDEYVASFTEARVIYAGPYSWNTRNDARHYG